MLTLRPAPERGTADFGDIRSRHSFSFGHYHDPAHMGVSHLRVLNDDRVAPGGGFPPHGHRDMEIISYVTSGVMEHADSLGNRFRIEAGQFQSMSAGSGVQHSEFNASRDAELAFLQIWIVPRARGLAPGYGAPMRPAEAPGEWVPVAAPDVDDALPLRQDARLSVGRFSGGERLTTRLAAGRLAYLHVVHGDVRVDGTPMEQGDGATVSGVRQFELEAREPAEVLLFDLAA